MSSHRITPELERTINDCNAVNRALWEYNTRDKKPMYYEGVEDALDQFRRNVMAVLRQPEIVEPADVYKMMKVMSEITDERIAVTIEAVSVLFREMHLRLQQTFCDQKKPTCTEYSASHPEKLARIMPIVFMQESDMHHLISIGEQTGNPLLTWDAMKKQCMSGGTILVGTNYYGGTIASYAFCDLPKKSNHINLVALNATPGFEDTYARERLLHNFNWSIPHAILKGMQKCVTTDPISLTDRHEIDFYGSGGYVAYAGERNTAGDLTHVRMGKLTDEFFNWEKL